jgi:hypothetical protein
MIRIASILGCVFLSTNSPCFSWESTRNGPLLSGLAPDGASNGLADRANDIKQRIRRLAVDPGLSGPSSSFLSQRTVGYPYQTGARLGDGWDFVTNTRNYSQCVEFGTAVSDRYQQANMDFTRSIDTETLSIALNVDTSAHASGGFAGIGGSAGGSFGLTSSYDFNSKDDVIVAHASVINGATYVTGKSEIVKSTDDQSIATPANPPNVGGVRLSKAALAALGSGDVFNFRTACGDGFVAAIGTGADAYILYHFKHMDNALRVKVTTSAEASGSIGGLFSAGGSLSSSLSFTQLRSNDQLAIYFAQNGGKIGGLPVQLEDVGSRISKLPTEAFDNGRPLYLIIVPYSELPNWPLKYGAPGAIDVRSALVRYLQRLNSVFNEVQNVIADFRNNGLSPTTAEYYHDGFHNLRYVDYAKLNDDILNEINLTGRYLNALDQGPCRSDRHFNKGQCSAALGELPNAPSFDDYRFWIQLPPPRNAMQDSTIALIGGSGNDPGARKYMLSLVLYNHWISRIADVRCQLFSECLQRNDRVAEYKSIMDMMSSAD